MFVNLMMVLALNRFEQNGGHLSTALKSIIYGFIIVLPLILGVIAIYLNNT